MNNADACGFGIARAGELHRCATEQDRPFVVRQHTAEDLHQRALAGSVLADNRMKHTRCNVKAHVVKRDDPAEAFRDVLNRDEGIGHGVVSL